MPGHPPKQSNQKTVTFDPQKKVTLTLKEHFATTSRIPKLGQASVPRTVARAPLEMRWRYFASPVFEVVILLVSVWLANAGQGETGEREQQQGNLGPSSRTVLGDNPEDYVRSGESCREWIREAPISLKTLLVNKQPRPKNLRYTNTSTLSAGSSLLRLSRLSLSYGVQWMDDDKTQGT